MQVPKKYYDEVFNFKGQWDMPSSCGLKILTHNGKPHIIVTELYQDNPGTTVTAAGKILADQICAAKGLDLAKAVYLECNPDTSSKLSFYDEKFFEVIFSEKTPSVYRQLSVDEVKVLYETKKPVMKKQSSAAQIDYVTDKISAIDAKFEAQKIAFSPLTFQAIRALLELKILQNISGSGENGLNIIEIAKAAGISEYGAGVLAEIGLGMGVLRCRTGTENSAGKEKFVLGKIGWFLLEDEMTAVNFNFTNDVCYKGAFDLLDSIKTGKPCGLPVFGDQWNTIYEALSSLPEHVKKSWFDFDHFYSDIAFPDALPIVFASSPGRLFDIGGNTAKWALACCKYNPDVKVTIIDLPGQTAVAQQNIEKSGFSGRISVHPCNVLDAKTDFPQNANAVWMSQFLDCFSLDQITGILQKIGKAVSENTDIWVLEPLWDMQRFSASAYSLQATSLYFTCMANGNSKMYRYNELCNAIERGGFELKAAHHNVGSNSYSLLCFRKKTK